MSRRSEWLRRSKIANEQAKVAAVNPMGNKAAAVYPELLGKSWNFPESLPALIPLTEDLTVDIEQCRRLKLDQELFRQNQATLSKPRSREDRTGGVLLKE